MITNLNNKNYIFHIQNNITIDKIFFYLQNNMITDINNNNYIFHLSNNITQDKIVLYILS